MLRAAESGTLHLEAEKWAAQYGDIVMCSTPNQKIVFLNSSRAIREAFTARELEQVINDRPQLFTSTVITNHDIVMASPSDANWSKLRKLFHSSIRFYGDGVEKIQSMMHIELRRLTERVLAMDTVTSARTSSKGGEGGGGGEEREVNMSDLLSDSLMCVLGMLITGKCPDPDVVRVMQRFDHDFNALSSPNTLSTLATFPFMRYLPGFYRNVCNAALRSREELLHALFTKTKATRVPGKPRGIVDTLLDEQTKPGADWLTDSHIHGVIMDTIIAAYLTSRETLLDLFLYLQHHPDVMRRIQAEVDQVIGERMPQIEDRNALPYTEAVLLETLRLSSFLPFGGAHECRRDAILQNYRLPGGSIVFANYWVAHRDPEVFEDPQHFRPERFLDDKGHVISAAHPTRHLLSFGVGKRSCPGETFARSRVFLYVTTLLQQFDILPPVKHPLLPLRRDSWESGLVLQLKPYHCVLRRRH
ncbi:cytochrome P450 1A1-like [Babylonia areolata]|uniref:cytochrome P450 1A1-like n=1 Tax=Babylonia areolata TaxID=304850 RepID=UPI003FD33658